MLGYTVINNCIRIHHCIKFHMFHSLCMISIVNQVINVISYNLWYWRPFQNIREIFDKEGSVQLAGSDSVQNFGAQADRSTLCCEWFCEISFHKYYQTLTSKRKNVKIYFEYIKFGKLALFTTIHNIKHIPNVWTYRCMYL